LGEAGTEAAAEVSRQASGDGRVCRALARAAALVKHRETARPIGENVLVVGLNVLFAASTDNRNRGQRAQMSVAKGFTSICISLNNARPSQSNWSRVSTPQ
jgi:hypothetical protein